MKLQLGSLIIAFIFIGDFINGYNWGEVGPSHPNYMGGPRWSHRSHPNFMGGPRHPHLNWPTGRIVGGTPTQPAEIPYQLRMNIMIRGREIHCGAVLVSAFNTQFALTAAHCVYDNSSRFTTTISPAKLKIIAGLHNLKNKAGTQMKIPYHVVKHAQYDDDTIAHDIAIVFFGTPFRTSSRVSPIQLPADQYPEPDELEISGWGSTTKGNPGPGQKYPDILQVTVIKTLDNAECKRRFTKNVGKISSKKICLLQPGVSVGMCSGDSGGPGVAIDSSGSLYLAGLASSHIGGCGNGQYPMFYTRVSAYVKWIQERIIENNNSR